MSTVQDFKNAPVGATATHQSGLRAVKTLDPDGDHWYATDYSWFSDSDIGDYGYVLDPIPTTGPSTAREALDLAWELAHPVKEGQVIPEGARYLEFQGSGLREYTTASDFKIRPGCGPIRTLDPLPEPLPDWTKAPAVIARIDNWHSCADPQVFARENKTGTQWLRDTKVYHWYELMDVTPLYPKEGKES